MRWKQVAAVSFSKSGSLSASGLFAVLRCCRVCINTRLTGCLDVSTSAGNNRYFIHLFIYLYPLSSPEQISPRVNPGRVHALMCVYVHARLCVCEREINKLPEATEGRVRQAENVNFLRHCCEGVKESAWYIKVKKGQTAGRQRGRK